MIVSFRSGGVQDIRSSVGVLEIVETIRLNGAEMAENIKNEKCESKNIT